MQDVDEVMRVAAQSLCDLKGRVVASSSDPSSVSTHPPGVSASRHDRISASSGSACLPADAITPSSKEMSDARCPTRSMTARDPSSSNPCNPVIVRTVHELVRLIVAPLRMHHQTVRLVVQEEEDATDDSEGSSEHTKSPSASVRPVSVTHWMLFASVWIAVLLLACVLAFESNNKEPKGL